MSSRHAAWLMLAALREGRVEDVRVTLSDLDRLIPAGSTAAEWERRDLLEGLGAEAVTHPGAHGNSSAFRALLEHLAGPEGLSAKVQ